MKNKLESIERQLKSIPYKPFVDCCIKQLQLSTMESSIEKIQSDIDSFKLSELGYACYTAQYIAEQVSQWPGFVFVTLTFPNNFGKDLRKVAIKKFIDNLSKRVGLKNRCLLRCKFYPGLTEGRKVHYHGLIELPQNFELQRFEVLCHVTWTGNAQIENGSDPFNAAIYLIKNFKETNFDESLCYEITHTIKK